MSRLTKSPAGGNPGRAPGTLLLGLLAGLVIAAFAGQVRADSWMPAKVEIYYSTDKQARFTVTPRGISTPLAYFEDAVKGKPTPGQARGANPAASGLLERLDHGVWTTVWRIKLINDVAPVGAMVSPDGRYVLTFDDWHFVGTGDHVVVIYGRDGQMIRVLKLSDLVPIDWAHALPRSVSSIAWAGEHRFTDDGERLMLSVVIPKVGTGGFEADDEGATTYANLPLNLADGAVLTPSNEAWSQALASATAKARADQLAEAKARAEFIAPLLGPTPGTDFEWHGYLEEAYFRIDADWKEGYPQKTVLRAPDAADYAASEGWLRDALHDQPFASDVIMIASPDPQHLVETLERLCRGVKAGSLKHARIYVAVTNAWRDRVAAALAPTGARFIQLDPTRPIPQRPVRLRMRSGD
jgi:hypothetical protein